MVDCKRVASDDLAPGMLLTVLEGQRVRRELPLGDRLVEVDPIEWYSQLKGDPLRVLEVSIPYLTVEVTHLQHRPRVIIDTRCCILVGVTESYAKSAEQPPAPSALKARPWWRFWRAAR